MWNVTSSVGLKTTMRRHQQQEQSGEDLSRVNSMFLIVMQDDNEILLL